ncbi:MAG: GTPase Era [Mobilitalea sp.]
MKDTKFKSGFVTLIGRPNVGKSTLMNQLIGQKIAITSDKPQTTRNRIQTVFTDEHGQVIFLDTPGIHKAQNKLGEYMVNVAERTMSEVDLVLWLVEPSTFIGAGEKYIAEQLKKVKTPVFLVINKMDLVKKEQLLVYIAAYKDICNFSEIIPVSALKGENTKVLMEQVFKYMPEGPQYYDEDTVTDQPERQIVAELIREKALNLLEDEIPHGIAVSIELMKERPETQENRVNPKDYYGNGMIDIEATIVCERDSHKGIIIGKSGSKLKQIGSQARREIENLLDCKVNLQLWVKVKKDWRDSDILMKNYGYNRNE